MQFENIPFVLFTLEVLKFIKSIDFNDLQSANIFVRFEAKKVSKLPISNNSDDWHQLNIFSNDVTLEVSKLLKFKDFSELQF